MYLTLLLLVAQEFGCLARLRVLHRRDQKVSEVWSAQVHRHDIETEFFSVFKVRVSDVMHKLYIKGLTAAKIRVVLCDDLCERNDNNPKLLSYIQVILIAIFSLL